MTERCSVMQNSENRLGSKKTKIGCIPGEWMCPKLRECCSKIGSGVTPKGGESTYLRTGVALVRSQNVLNESFSSDGLRFISKAQHEKMKASALRVNDILFNITGASIGRCCLFPSGVGEANVNQHVCIVRVADDFSPGFFKSVLNSRIVRKQLYENQAGGGREGLNFQNLGAFRIPLPPHHEQVAIAGVLECWDKAIRNYEKKIEKKRNIKEGLMQRLLSGKQRLPGFFGEWKNMEFSNIAQISKSKYIPKLEENRVCLELEHIEPRTGKIIGKTSSIDQSSIKNVFRSGDVLFGKLRPYLRKYARPDFDGVCSTEIWVLESNQNISCNEYIFWLIQTSSFIGAANVTSGTKMPRADWSYISNYSFPIAPMKEQKAIAAVLSAADGEIEALERKLVILKDQKKFLLNNLVTGTIRLPQFRGGTTNTGADGDHA
ncbi:MAG: restriction endonuclease subunit S [Planctomycetota bacterium]